MRPGLFKSTPIALTILAAAISLAACGREQDAQPIATQAKQASNADACEVLAASNPDSVLGAAHDGGVLLFSHKSGDVSMSQCQYTTSDGSRQLGLALRHARNGAAPGSRQAFIDVTRAEDVMGAGEETAAALEAGKEIAGLGDLAVTYDLITFNLLFWKGSYQATVMLGGFAGGEAEQHAIAVARAVLDQL